MTWSEAKGREGRGEEVHEWREDKEQTVSCWALVSIGESRHANLEVGCEKLR